MERVEHNKANQLMKKEQDWMRRMPKARTTKSKSRIDAFYDIQEKASGKKKEAELRLEIWRRLVSELEGPRELERMKETIAVLAEEQSLSGAQIKSAILSAMFAAGSDGGPLGAEHLLRGVDRELGKEGRRVGADLRARLLAKDGRALIEESLDA